MHVDQRSRPSLSERIWSHKALTWLKVIWKRRFPFWWLALSDTISDVCVFKLSFEWSPWVFGDYSVLSDYSVVASCVSVMFLRVVLLVPLRSFCLFFIFFINFDTFYCNYVLSMWFNCGSFIPEHISTAGAQKLMFWTKSCLPRRLGEE